MKELEQVLLNEMTGGAEPGLCIRTGTSVDAGLWWRKVPLWLCVCGDRLILLAVARRRYVQTVKLSECVDSEYCHATGELVIQPAEGLEYNRVAMKPADALKVLSVLKAARRDSGDEGGKDLFNQQV